MRWDALFADLDAQWREADEEFAGEVAERSLIEQGRLLLNDRLAANRGHPLEVRACGAGVLQGELVDCGPDWLLLATRRGQALVALAAVVSIRGLTRSSRHHDSGGVVGSRLDLRYALRRLARETATINAHLLDGTTRAGRLVRVAADFIEIDDGGETATLLPTGAIAAVSG